MGLGPGLGTGLSSFAPPVCRRVLAWDSVPDWEHCRLFALCRRVGFGALFSLFLFYLPCFFFFSFLKLPVGVSGSVPEREHDHSFLSVGETGPRLREHFFLCFFFIYLAFFSFLKCRRVGLGPGAGT